MKELDKLNKKIELWNNNECSFIQDSITNEVINMEFQSVDNGLYLRLNQHTKRTDTNYLMKLKQGHKLVRWL